VSVNKVEIVFNYEGEPLSAETLDRWLIYLGGDFAAILKQNGHKDPAYIAGLKHTQDEEQ
jgi:arsenate reductase-like glutaredoxin family protein